MKPSVGLGHGRWTRHIGSLSRRSEDERIWPIRKPGMKLKVIESAGIATPLEPFGPGKERLPIDAESIAGYREQLKRICAGVPIAEAALESYCDWQVVAAIESLWAAAL
jgi:hypothetical protein